MDAVTIVARPSLNANSDQSKYIHTRTGAVAKVVNRDRLPLLARIATLRSQMDSSMLVLLPSNGQMVCSRSSHACVHYPIDGFLIDWLTKA